MPKYFRIGQFLPCKGRDYRRKRKQLIAAQEQELITKYYSTKYWKL